MRKKKELYALFLDHRDGPLHPLASEFQALGIEVLRAESSNAALSMIKKRPLRSLVAVLINETVNSEDMAIFVAQLSLETTSAPILWISAPRSLATSVLFPRGPTRFLSSGTDSETLSKAASDLLQGYLYPMDLARHLREAGQGVLCDSFSTRFEAQRTLLKANSNSLGSLHASIGFSGLQIRGHLLLSTTQDVAQEILRNLFGQEGPVGELVDLIGEICNQVLGRVRPFLACPTLGITMPILVSGQELVFRVQSSQPTLVAPFQHHAGALYACMYLEDCAVEVVPDSEVDLIGEAGELVFL